MIYNPSIRNSKTTKTATGAVNYVLSDYDAGGNLRAVKPEIMMGNPELTKMLDHHKNSPKNNKATSGVIALRDNERLDDKQQQKLIERWQELVIHQDLRDRVNCLVVKHQEKGNLEFHVIVNHVLESGQRYNPHPIVKGDHGKRSIIAAQATQRVLNYEFGFQQVIANTNNNRNGLSNSEIQAKKSGVELPLTKDKEKLDRLIKHQIKEGNITSREQLLENLKNKGYEIRRAGQDYISVKSPNQQKAMRLKGGIYSNDKTVYERMTNKGSDLLVQTKYTPLMYQKDLELIDQFRYITFNQTQNGQSKLGKERESKLVKVFDQQARKIEKLKLTPDIPVELTKNADSKNTHRTVESNGAEHKQQQRYQQEGSEQAPEQQRQHTQATTPTIQIDQPQQHQQPHSAGQGLSGEAPASSGVGSASASLESAQSELSAAKAAIPKDQRRIERAEMAVKLARLSLEQAEKQDREQVATQSKKPRFN